MTDTQPTRQDRQPPAGCPVRDYAYVGPKGPALHSFERMDAHRAAARPALWTGEEGGYWVFTDHDAIVDGLRDWRLWSSEVIMPSEPDPQYTMVPIMLDGPEHTRWRRLLASWFTPARVRGMLDDQHRLAAGIIDDVAGRGECDFLGDVATVFPSLVFLQMMGLPAEHLPRLRGWVDLMVHFDPERDHADERMAAMGEVFGYFAELIAARRADPDPMARDLVSHAVHWQIDGRPVSDDALLNCMNVLLGAGLDTVSAQTTYGMLHLAGRPELRRRLTADPALWPKAVDEILRIYPIVQLTRKATRDTEFHGCPVRAGDVAVFPLSSAGRDEHKHANPFEIDLDRPMPAYGRRLAFGAGPHFCAGAHLALQQMAVLLEQWHRRVPDYTLAETPREVSGGLFGCEALPLRWTV